MHRSQETNPYRRDRSGSGCIRLVRLSVALGSRSHGSGRHTYPCQLHRGLNCFSSSVGVDLTDLVNFAGDPVAQKGGHGRKQFGPLDRPNHEHDPRDSHDDWKH